MDREGERARFSPSVGLVLLQGESFKILPPMRLLVFTLMTPLLSPCFFFFLTPWLSWIWCCTLSFLWLNAADTHLIYACIQINNACLLTGIKASGHKILFAPSDSGSPPSPRSRHQTVNPPPPPPWSTMLQSTIWLCCPRFVCYMNATFPEGECLQHLLSVVRDVKI